MSRLDKIVTAGYVTNDASTYVGKRGEITLNVDNLTLSVHNGFYPYTIGPLYFGGLFQSTSSSRDTADVFPPNAYSFLIGPNSGATVYSLPPATHIGTIVVVMIAGNNLGTNTATIFAYGNDTINGVANNPIDYTPIGNGGMPTAPLYFICNEVGSWWTNGILD